MSCSLLFGRALLLLDEGRDTSHLLLLDFGLDGSHLQQISCIYIHLYKCMQSTVDNLLQITVCIKEGQLEL